MKNDNDNNNNNSRNSGMKKKKKKRVEIVIRSKRKNLGQQQQHRILDKLESRIIFFWNENFSRCFFSFHFSNEKTKIKISFLILFALFFAFRHSNICLKNLNLIRLLLFCDDDNKMCKQNKAKYPEFRNKQT